MSDVKNIEISRTTAKDIALLASLAVKYGKHIPYGEGTLPRIDVTFNDTLADGEVILVREDGTRGHEQ